MLKTAVLFCAAVLPIFSQPYKLETFTAGPAGLPAGYAALVDATGYRVVGPSGPWVEIWFRKAIPTGPKSSDPAITLPIGQGTFLGILRFPANGADRRGQT